MITTALAFIRGNTWILIAGAVGVAVVAYFTQVGILHNHIDSQAETIADQHTELTNLRLTLGNQNLAINNILVIKKQVLAHNLDLVTAHELDKQQADRDAVKARARLKVALMVDDCAVQALPESIRLEF